jgi:hypothetical protein
MSKFAELARFHANNSIINGGDAQGICNGLISIVFAILFSKSGSEKDSADADKYARRAVSESGFALGICSGLAAITYSILASSEK